MISDNLKANFIYIVHVCIVVFIVITPFVTDFSPLLLLHAVSCASLLLHWIVESDVCFLSILESKFRKIEREKTFIHELVGPVYNFSTKEDESNFTKLITIMLMIISLYRIRYDELLKMMKELFNLLKKSFSTY